MKIVLLIASLFIVNGLAAPSLNLASRWQLYKVKHGKNYPNAETDKMRYNLWVECVEMIEKHNKLYEAGKSTYSLGENRFCDMTKDERKQTKGFKASMLKNRRSIKYQPSFSDPTPESQDWRQQNKVTPIKNQLTCGSCWAFSAIASFETQYAMKTANLTSFSEQELIDCVTGADGCEGGLMDVAFTWLEQRGLETERAYPYTATDGSCKYNSQKVRTKPILYFVDLPSGDEGALKDAVGKIGVMSVAIDADDKFQFYRSGIFDDENCGNEPKDLDHGVAIVGYGTDNEGIPYWILRNSWGAEQWGEAGYMRIRRNHNNMCGVATMASYPQLALTTKN